MIYPEFEQFESFVDPLNPYCNAYKTKEGHIFYVEPGFYSGMQGFKEKREERYQDLLNGIFDDIKKNEQKKKEVPKFVAHIADGVSINPMAKLSGNFFISTS